MTREAYNRAFDPVVSSLERGYIIIDHGTLVRAPRDTKLCLATLDARIARAYNAEIFPTGEQCRGNLEAIDSLEELDRENRPVALAAADVELYPGERIVMQLKLYPEHLREGTSKDLLV